jgi:polypeptide N-acetylgalactosaminyltransferase
MVSARTVLILTVGPCLLMVIALVAAVLASILAPSEPVKSPPPLPKSRSSSNRASPYGKLGFPLPPDTRPVGCDPSGDDPKVSLNTTVSIVIPYLNEDWDYMQGTVNSILHFTPDRLLEQIIFVSDGNRHPRVEELEAMSPKLKVLVLPKRQGLIKAKMRGMELVKASVVVFLEPHCIVNRRWLEPLLVRIEAIPRGLVMPVLDAIPQDNFRSYQRAAVGHFRLEWNFNLIYTAPAGLEDSSKPYPSPATSGGIFAMKSEWFQHLELFDTGMRQWGGDHVELTMKAWRCGGRIDIVPCSRVGHMFRDSVHQPYTVKVQQIVKNYARLAHIWTDRHINAFWKVKPEAKRMEVGDLRNLSTQRERLKCKNMDWYLKHVDFELGWEVSRICIPGAARGQGGCRGKAVIGRSTIDQLMPVQDYVKAKSSAHSDEESAKALGVQAIGLLPLPSQIAAKGDAPVQSAEPAMRSTSSREQGRGSSPEPTVPIEPRRPESRRPTPAIHSGDQRWEAAQIVGLEEEEEEL